MRGAARSWREVKTYLDMHCDTLWKAFAQKREEIYDFPEAMLDVRRIQKAEVLAQFFAVFFPPNRFQKKDGTPYSDEEYFAGAAGILKHTIQAYPDVLSLALSYEDMAENRRQGRVSAFLTMEDGRAVQGSIDRLCYFYKQGVRLITLTWNGENCFGAPNSKDASLMKKGLTPFGREAVEVMNELGMIADVSHLSDGGFYDVAEHSKKPFIASHSNCRNLCPHPRNLTDEMIRILAEKGGVCGLNFWTPFLEPGAARTTFPMLLAHIKHMIRTGGEDFPAIGTDFDGISGEHDVSSPLEMENFFEYLEMEGLSGQQIEKLAYRNAERVIKETLIYSDEKFGRDP